MELKDAIIIAIDGWSSCGKSTLAKAVAKELTYGYIDTGAMYRACTLYFLEKGTDISNAEQVKQALLEINISFKSIEGKNTTFLNGKNVEEEIRTMPVSNMVSPVAELSAVRKDMVRQQQEMGKEKAVVLDGRDIGTVVFPEAELKIFLTASPEIRTQRRFDELQNKGMDISMEEVQQNLLERDRIDSSREDSPLKQADDAILLDNSNIDLDTSVKMVLNWVKEIQEK